MASRSIVGTVTEDGVWASTHGTSCSGRNSSASAVWGPQIFCISPTGYQSSTERRKQRKDTIQIN